MCACHQTVIRCQVVCRRPDASVMGALLCLSPSLLILISQVDKHISSSSNPSPWIPAHMHRIHTNRQQDVCTHIRKRSWAQMHTHKLCYLGTCGRSAEKENTQVQKSFGIFAPFSWAQQWRCKHTVIDESDVYQPSMLDLTGFKLSYFFYLRPSLSVVAAQHSTTHLQIIPCHWLLVVGPL